MGDDPEIWLTYEEAAARLGIKADSVRRRAASKKWARRQGNDGLARVRIPHDAIRIPTPDATPAVTPDDPDNSIRDEIDQLRKALSESREELAASRAETSGLRDRLSDTQAERDRLAALLDRALEARPIQTTAASATGQPASFWARLLGRS